MKANEAPEKIYLPNNPVLYISNLNERTSEDDIEYIRTNAFIEKACAWLENNLKGIVGGSIYINDFKNYMERE